MSCDKQLSNTPEYNQIVRHYLWTDLQLNTGIVTSLIYVYYFRTPDFYFAPGRLWITII